MDINKDNTTPLEPKETAVAIAICFTVNLILLVMAIEFLLV